MLKKIRIVLATLIITFLTLLFLDFTGSIHLWLGWLAKLQLIPAILSLNIAVLVIIAVVTLFFGRIYCSTICPLGVFQDGVANIGRIGKQSPYSFTQNSFQKYLRYSILFILIIAIILGLSVVVSFLDPYAAYGRIANNLFQPIWQFGNNILAYLSERFDSYHFYVVDIWVKSAVTFSVAIITLLIISLLAWKKGRLYCNSICPVGTLLGLISNFSIFRVKIANDKCNSCGICSANCKSSCIDSEHKTVDNSRCVNCFNCIDKCNRGAISFTHNNVNSSEGDSNNKGRRGFLATSILLTTTLAKSQTLPKVVEMKADGGLAHIEDKLTPNRETPILPPGSISDKNMNKKCTACQLCISVCPNNILIPSISLEKFMQPHISFNSGYCRPECVKCSLVCPSGAISKISVADKSSTQLGRAVWIEKNCVVVTKGDKCEACSANCPTQAITLIDLDHANKVPMINNERCIGCGACEYLCPARPISAIFVEGNKTHRTV